MPLILYQRDDCHLCDLALDVLANARIPEFESVFIGEDDALEARYGIRVPVLHRSDTGAELDWPFGVDAVAAFLQA
jgi:hypothetical protein